MDAIKIFATLVLVAMAWDALREMARSFQGKGERQ